MGSGSSECVPVMGLMLLMQFHLVVLFFFWLLFVCLSVSPPAFRGSLPSLPCYPPLPSLKWD